MASWQGITCDEVTGHVIELDLSCSQLKGRIGSNNNLFQLFHLQSLNLANNMIESSKISISILIKYIHPINLNLQNKKI
ncbi:hypothetical protein Leryth_001438 [Lithospermum erythrorhizon]|nr:hypothetical protein Leryth_001438 [Lithospermum erythrorhizon]